MKTWMEVFKHIMDSDIVLDVNNKVVPQVFNVPEKGQMMIGGMVFRPEDNQEVNAGSNSIYLIDMYGKAYNYTTWNANNFKWKD